MTNFLKEMICRKRLLIVRKPKVIRYELIPILSILSITVGFLIFYIQHQAQKMNDNGVALNLRIEGVEEWSQPFELFLLIDGEKKIMLEEAATIKKSTVHKIVLFDGTADLIWAADGHEYKLVTDINGLNRQELELRMRVSANAGKLNFDTRYQFNPLVDFSKYQ